MTVRMQIFGWQVELSELADQGRRSIWVGIRGCREYTAMTGVRRAKGWRKSSHVPVAKGRPDFVMRVTRRDGSWRSDQFWLLGNRSRWCLALRKGDQGDWRGLLQMGDSLVEVWVLDALRRSHSCLGVVAEEIGNAVDQRLRDVFVEQRPKVGRFSLHVSQVIIMVGSPLGRRTRHSWPA
jgi:hypothetical protein